jgi:hypothetical protein
LNLLDAGGPVFRQVGKLPPITELLICTCDKFGNCTYCLRKKDM